MSSVKSNIAKILNVAESPVWEITASNDAQTLHSVHYTESADKAIFGALRGIVVDTQAEKVVAKSYGYTPSVILNELSAGLTFVDEDGTSHTLTEETTIQKGYEGTVIRVFKHGGQVYRTTHRRLDCSRSRWGTSKTFLQMYWDLEGPTDEELFGEEESSPICYMFILVHPDVLVASRERVGAGYLVYLGHHNMESGDKTTKPRYQPKPAVVVPEPLSLEEGNHVLQHGHYLPTKVADPRLGYGEFVILHFPNNQLVKVCSTAYAYRQSLRDNNSNVVHQFYCLIDKAKLDYSTYQTEIPIVTPVDPVALAEELKHGPILEFPQETPNPEWIEWPINRLENTWMAYFMAVPIHLQPKIVGLFDQVVRERKEVAKWIFDRIYKGGEVSSRVQFLKDLALRFASEQAKRFRLNPVSYEYKKILMSSLNNAMSKENGASLYKLVKEMKAEKSVSV